MDSEKDEMEEEREDDETSLIEDVKEENWETWVMNQRMKRWVDMFDNMY